MAEQTHAGAAVVVGRRALHATTTTATATAEVKDMARMLCTVFDDREETGRGMRSQGKATQQLAAEVAAWAGARGEKAAKH